MLWPEMWLRATGQNLFEKSAFYRTTPDYLLYLIMPAGHWLANDGDGPMDSLGGLGYSFAPDAVTFHFYGWRNKNPYARWLARHMSGWPHANIERLWQAILWADHSKEEKPLNDLPPVKFFSSNGVAILRSGWDLSAKSGDIVAAFYCRPFESHTHYNAGDFMIWRGLDELVCRGGYYMGTENTYHHNFFIRTVAHNCALIYDPNEPVPFYGKFMMANDGGQLRGDPACYPNSYRLLMGNNPFFYRGEIRTFVDDPQFTYLFADVTPAYNATKAVRVARAFLWLKPSTFVICDWATSTKPQFAKRWLLHSANKPSVAGAEKVVTGTSDAGILESTDSHFVTLQRGASKLSLQTPLPEHAVIRRIGGEGFGFWVDGKNWEPPATTREFMEGKRKDFEAAEATKRFWRIEIEPTEQSAEAVFLNVLDATAKDGKTPPVAALLRREKAAGVTLKRGDASHEALFYPDGRVRVDGKTVGQSLEPLKPYVVPERLGSPGKP